MKKLSKLRLPLIERELSVLNEEELRAYIGGQKQSCVFNCFDYLDGSLHSANDYYNWTKQGLGYEPDEHGNVDISDVGTIGGYGGFNVSKVNSGESFILRSDGQTSNGERVMAVFAVGSESNEEGHAVVINCGIVLILVVSNIIRALFFKIIVSCPRRFKEVAINNREKIKCFIF